MKQPTRTDLLRILLFAVAAIIIVYFLPRIDHRTYTYQIDRPWSHPLLTAPFDIPIHLDSVSANRVRDSIERNFVPVYERRQSVQSGIMATLRTRLGQQPGLSAQERNRIESVVASAYQSGIVDPVTYSEISSRRLPEVRMLSGNVARAVSTATFRSPRRAYAWIDSMLPAPAHHRALEHAELSSLLEPNVVMDSVNSGRMLAEQLQKAMAPVGVCQTGERIVDRGELVTPTIYTILQTYERMMAEKGTADASRSLYSLGGKALYVLLMLSCLYLFLYFFRPRLFRDMKVIQFLLLLIVVFTVFAFLLSSTFNLGLYIVPFTMVPIMVIVFFDGRTALFCHLLTVLICACIAAYPLEFVFMQFTGGVVAINSLKELSRRSQLLRTALLVFGAYVLSYLSVELMQSGTITGLAPKMIGFCAINVVFVSFAYVLIFVVEKMFGFTSVVALVELSDINNPVLRELSGECPGTFQHSMSVSNLASEAAHRIGANVQLVRTGALYHDIGKINNPAFFTENQHGVNPHDALDPVQSARVVISHVADGLKRAERANLPRVIRNFIREHHGRGTARYFFNTYCAAHPDEEVDPSPFTYPGPNPQSRETSILMMADAVEAASRSLKDYSTEAITTLVNNIIDKQIAEGFHNESTLSFRDVAEIKDTFIRRLLTIYHSRIAYPADVKNSQK